MTAELSKPISMLLVINKPPTVINITMSILRRETIKSWFLKSTIFSHTFKDTWAFENKTLS